MDKGIRPYCNAKFVELLNLRNRGELTNTQFRKNVMADVMENFGITLASAATHYNHAFITVKALNSELVSGLGRPEDKKGGRKRKAVLVTEAIKAILGDVAPVEFIDQQFADTAPAAAVVQTLLSEGIKENTSTHTVTVNPEAAPQTYTVTRAKDGVVVATGLVLTDAEALCAKAVQAKKAKLVFA